MELKFEHVTYLCGKKRILEDIQLTFQSGKLYGILGPSGSGKTTLALLMNGLYQPTLGTIYLDQYQIKNKGPVPRNIRKKASIVFQNPDSQFFEDTVYKEILFGVKNLKLSQKNIDEKIKVLLKQLELKEDILNRNPFLLSAGEKRKVALISILILDPEVFILDEPTIGLDYHGKELLRKLLLRLKKEKLIIVISHDVDFLHQVMDEVVILKDGHVIKKGNKYEVFQEERSLKRHRIKPPEMMEFINLINQQHSFEYYDDMKELMKAVYRDVK